MEWDSEAKTVLGCVPLIWSGSGSVIRDHLDHGRSNEPINPCPQWIHQFILENDSKQSDEIRLPKTSDCLKCKVLPSCKVWAQTDKNCKSYWPRLQFQVLCWPGVFNAIEDDEIHFLCYCPKYSKLRNEFFVQIKRHLHNFPKICILIYDWRLISHYWIICVTEYTVM